MFGWYAWTMLASATGPTASVSLIAPCSLIRMSVIVFEAAEVDVQLVLVVLDEPGDLVERAAEVVQRLAEIGPLAGEVTGDLGELLLEVLDLAVAGSEGAR